MDYKMHEKDSDIRPYTMEPSGNTISQAGVDMLLPRPTEVYQPPIPGTITVIDSTKLKNFNDILCPDGTGPENVLKILPFEGIYQRVSTTDMSKEPVFEVLRNFQPRTPKGEASIALRTFNYILWAIIESGRFTRTEVYEVVKGDRKSEDKLIDEFVKRKIITGKGGHGVRGTEDFSVVPRVQILDLRTAADLIPPQTPKPNTATTRTASRRQNRHIRGYRVYPNVGIPETEGATDDPVQLLLNRESEILERMVQSWDGPTRYLNPEPSITPEELEDKSTTVKIMAFMTGKLEKLPFELDDVDVNEIFNGYQLANESEHVVKIRARRLEDWLHDKNFYIR